jgi:hypothetical protein
VSAQQQAGQILQRASNDRLRACISSAIAASAGPSPAASASSSRSR